MALGSFSLPGTVNPGNQALTAIGQAPQMLADQQSQRLDIAQKKQQLEQGKFQMEQAQQQQGLQRLSLFYRMLQADPTGQKHMDPQMVSAISQAAKAAGFSSVTHIDPATGQEVVDPNALKLLTQGKTMNDLSEAEQKEFGQLLTTQKGPWLERHGIDPSLVPEDVLKEGPELPPKDRATVINQFSRQLAELPKGQQTPQGIVNQFNLMGPELAAAGVSIGDMQSMLRDPNFINQTIGPAIEAKANQLRALGISETAIARYKNEQSVIAPQMLAERIRTDGTRLYIAQENADTNKQNAGTRASMAQTQRDLGMERLAQGQQRLTQTAARDAVNAKRVQAYIDHGVRADNIGAAKALIALRTPQIRQLQNERDDLTKVLNTWMTNHPGKEPPQEMLDNITQISQQVDASSDSLEQLRAMIPGAQNAALGNNMGNKNVRDVPSFPNPPGMPQGATFAGKGPHGGDLYRMPDGSTKEYNG